MQKSLFSAVLGLSVAITLPLSAVAQGFTDVTGTVYEQAAVALAQDKVIAGNPDGTLLPFNPISRAEAIKMVIAAQPQYATDVTWFSQHPSPIALFSDMTPSAWYTPYIEVAFKHGIITGYSNDSLGPTNTVTGSEAIAMIDRAFAGQGSSTYATSTYVENQPGAWYTPYVNDAIAKNLIMHAGYVQLDYPVNRGQFLDMLYRMREVKSKNLTAYNGPEAGSANAAVSIIPAISNTYGPPSIVATTALSDDAKYVSSKSFAITIPALGIKDLTISDPKDPKSAEGVLVPLKSGVGHLFAYPGQGSKILVYGHSSGYPWDTSSYTKIFRTINKLKNGDKVYVTYAGKLHVYEISGHKTVAAKDTSPYKPDGKGEQLILYTCWPPDSISQRYLQFATPVQQVSVK